ncbi:MAG: cobalamin biosynthesis protein [Actinobacteria bacterium]|nr:cobalamin biosynthesis protein [Actinomycetota bacterium]MCG2808123.1 cobalamin biosynthesis protein [Coriobacteriia bacterium]
MRFTRTGPIAVIFVSEEGAALAGCIASALPEATLWASRAGLHPDARAYEGTLRDFVGELWDDHAAIVAVMAVGIVVRSIAPWVASKLADPAVVVLDDAGRFAISLLSGHEGGANELAGQLGELTGAVPVVTTGTEARRGVVLGVGSRRGVTRETVLAAIDESLAAANRRRADVRALSTIDLKADEVGIREAADVLGVPVRIVSRERIRTLQEVLRESTFAEEVTGVAAVCVPSALLADPHTRLLVPPIARQGVTVAVAEDDCPSSASVPVLPPT